MLRRKLLRRLRKWVTRMVLLLRLRELLLKRMRGHICKGLSSGVEVRTDIDRIFVISGYSPYAIIRWLRGHIPYQTEVGRNGSENNGEQMACVWTADH